MRTSQDLLATFFPHDDKLSTDKVFKYLPNEVRGPIVAAWGIRGMKAAMRDNDDRIQQVVYDALVAGDIDHQAFEDGLGPETLVRWVPLADLWAFWRGGKLSKQAIHKAMATAYELYLFDARWFLETLSAKGGSLKGTDVLADGLTKDDLTQWMRRIHETGDGTPKGIVAALGWEKIVAKTSNDVLVAVLDAVVAKVGLVVAPPAAAKDSSPRVGESAGTKAESPAAKAEAKAEPPPATGAPSPGAPGAEEPKPATAAAGPEPRPTEKPGGDDAGSWSMPPGPPEGIAGMPLEDTISVVVEDDELGGAAPPTAPRMRAAAPVEETEDTKVTPRGRSQAPAGSVPPGRPSGAPPPGGSRR